ncbi:MAG: ADP-ribosylglycohydrolase family protein, partial [Pseudonocardiaceae bacterium]
WFAGQRPEAGEALRVVAAAAEGSWQPGPNGVPLDAAQTVAAVVHVLRTRADLASALPFAVSLGGDTDTVAALVGGILGGRQGGAVAELPWLDRVRMDDRDRVTELASRLSEQRRTAYVD